MNRDLSNHETRSRCLPQPAETCDKPAVVTTALGHHVVTLAASSPEESGGASLEAAGFEAEEDLSDTMDSVETTPTAKEEWGKLTEEFTTTLNGRRIHVLVYSRRYDDTWTLFTTVDARTGRVIRSELSLT